MRYWYCLVYLECTLFTKICLQKVCGNLHNINQNFFDCKTNTIENNFHIDVSWWNKMFGSVSFEWMPFSWKNFLEFCDNSHETYQNLCIHPTNYIRVIFLMFLDKIKGLNKWPYPDYIFSNTFFNSYQMFQI